jgi:hypothetical protein
MRIRQGGADASYKEVSVINPSRGLNLLISDILVNDKEATNGSKNIEFAEGGVARKRPGTRTVGTGLVNTARGLGKHISELSSYPITADGGTLKRYLGGSWSALAGAVTVDASADISFTSLADKTYAWDGINGGVVWDGTTLTRPGTMPRASFSVTYKGWHVATGVSGQPFRLYFAPSKEPSRFTDSIVPVGDAIGLNDAANVPGATVFAGAAAPKAIDINRNDGEKVTGLGFFQDVLIVFKESSIYQLYFNETGGFVVERISSSYGCVSHASIASVENDCYFLSENGVYVLGNEPNYYASIRTNELSSRIKPLLQQVAPTNWKKCSAVYYDDRYWLTVPIGGTQMNTLIVYDRRFYAWMVWDGIYANDMLVFKDDQGGRHFYFTDDRTASMKEFTWGVYNDDGAAINAVFRTRAFEGKQIDHEKFWYVLHPIFRDATGEVKVGYITEHGSEGRTVSINNSILGGIGMDGVGLGTFGYSLLDTFTDTEFNVAPFTITEYNLVTNPSFEVSTAGWSSIRATIATTSSTAIQGSQSLQCTVTSVAGNSAATYSFSGFTVGKTYTVSAYVKANLNDLEYIYCGELNNMYAEITTASGGWQRISATGTCTSASGTIEFGVAASTVAVNDIYYVDGVMIQQSAGVGVYFDGSTAPTSDASASVMYAWDGTAGLSTSRRLAAYTGAMTSLNNTTTITDSSNLVYELPIALNTRTCKIEFSNNNVNETFTLLGWKMLYQEKDGRRQDGQFVIR